MSIWRRDAVTRVRPARAETAGQNARGEAGLPIAIRTCAGRVRRAMPARRAHSARLDTATATLSTSGFSAAIASTRPRCPPGNRRSRGATGRCCARADADVVVEPCAHSSPRTRRRFQPVRSISRLVCSSPPNHPPRLVSARHDDREGPAADRAGDVGPPPNRCAPRPGRPFTASARHGVRGVASGHRHAHQRALAYPSGATCPQKRRASSTCVEEASLVLAGTGRPSVPLQRIGTHHHHEAAVWTRMHSKGLMDRSVLRVPEEVALSNPLPPLRPSRVHLDRPIDS